ncbi:MAG: N-acetyltransferase [Sphingomonas sp.]|uniref:GNAT family N-acetyltransferase n=1 Tax=unclassified Sphingomonas TaxID=196159 RepID=UPI0024573200|nr:MULTISPECIES: N-acetyltransferase [unclassified Sphingomonas]MBQ1498045.1 N-acetyltransferase [Sphingomonas sp.]MDH4742621.1 N-acetyltransferase [Sphingomonas sp. CBMAI 2297]
MSIAIRPATGGDVAAIDALLRRAFPAEDEARLVQRLCIDGDMVLTLVADDEETGALAGMIAFSRMDVAIAGKPIAAVALAPLAVEAAWRKQGVGEALVQAGIAQLADAGGVLAFVLGDPAYYGRFGFAAEWARGFASPYAGDYLMALPLQGGAMPCGVRGAATHAPAFAALGQDV